MSILNHERKPQVKTMSEIHTVFGAGQVGLLLARELGEAGQTVRLVRRGPAGATMAGVTWMRGDATDRSFADEACRGATAVYNCTNPPDYVHWDGVLQPLYRAVWAAAARAGARVVQLENLYMYGRPATSPFDEQTPMEPCSDKGRLRLELLSELMEADARGDVRATVGHASDFFGPDTPNATVLRPEVIEQIASGSTVTMFCNPDVVHGYTYTPDVAAGLATLGRHPDAVGRRWHLPTSATSTTRALIERFAQRAQTQVKLRRAPRWILKTVGVVSPLVSAVVAMDYQWEVPYVLDDAAFVTTFGQEATPLDAAIDATLRAARTRAAA